MTTRPTNVLLALAGIGLLAGAAHAVDVYMISSGNADWDQLAETTLEDHGHNATIGTEMEAFDGSLDLSAYDVVLVMANTAYYPFFPEAGQLALVDFVNQGGGLVTTEWFLWTLNVVGGPELDAIVPVTYDGYTYFHDDGNTFTQTAVDPIMNDGLPASFHFIGGYASAETYFSPKAGAKTFYTA